MADPTIIEIAGNNSTAATTTVSFAAQPAGTLLHLSVAADDYRVLSGTNRPEANGWTYLDGREGNLGCYAWWKIATGSETSVPYQIGSATRSSYTLLALSNIDGTPLGVTAANASSVGTNVPNHTTPPLTPAAGSRWCVIATVGSTGNATAGPYTWAGSFTKRSERYHTAGYRPGVTTGTATVDGGSALQSTVTFASATNVNQGIAIVAAYKVAVAGGTTPVSVSRSTSWRVRAAVTATRITTWRTLASALTSRPTSWDVRRDVSTQRSTTWNVDGTKAPVTATRSTAWAVKATVTATRSTSWATKARVSALRPTSWDARREVTASRPTTWHTRTLITATRSTTWNVLTRIIRAVATTWDTRTQVSTQRSTAWNVDSSRITVTATRSTSWRTLARASATRATSWDTRQTVSNTRSTSWDIRTSVVRLATTTWRTLAAAATIRPTSWRVLERVTTQTPTSWAVQSDALPPVLEAGPRQPARFTGGPARVEAPYTVTQSAPRFTTGPARPGRYSTSPNHGRT